MGEVYRCEIGVRAGNCAPGQSGWEIYMPGGTRSIRSSFNIPSIGPPIYVSIAYHEEGISPFRWPSSETEDSLILTHNPVKKTPIRAHRLAQIEVVFGQIVPLNPTEVELQIVFIRSLRLSNAKRQPLEATTPQSSSPLTHHLVHPQAIGQGTSTVSSGIRSICESTGRATHLGDSSTGYGTNMQFPVEQDGDGKDYERSSCRGCILDAVGEFFWVDCSGHRYQAPVWLVARISPADHGMQCEGGLRSSY